MAEQVQEVLDQMVAPLADLMDRNIFSQSEIHAIVSRRRESEYLLRRRSPRKADFLRYIQDELQLEKLRQLRTKKQQAVERERLAKLGKLQEDSITNKNHIGDSHIIQHIHLLFRKTLRKYNKEDVSIYLQYADVCKQLRSWNKLPQVYAEAVQIHPHEPGLWIEAASHEFFHRQSVSTARVLLQRALRVNKKAKDLWLQSFALEFHHIAKLQGRRTILQLDDDKEGKEMGTSLESPLFAIAKIVYDNAIEAIPDDVSFRLGFLELCRTFPFTESMEAYIFDTIKRDFADTPKAWIARASHVLEQLQRKEAGEEKPGFIVAPEETPDDAEDEEDRPAKKKRRTRSNSKDAASQRDQEDPALAMLQEAIGTITTSEMYVEAVRFAWGYWENAHEVFSDPTVVANKRRTILSFIEKLLEDACENSNVYTIAVVLEHARYFTRLEKHEKALQVLENYVQYRKGIHTAIWLQLVACTLHVKSARAARAVLQRARKDMPLNHPDHLKLLLESLGASIAVADEGKQQEDIMEEVTDIFQRILLLAAGGSVAKPPADVENSEIDSYLENTSPFGITSVAEACLHYLMYTIRFLDPLKGVRKSCNLVLHQSNFVDHENYKTPEDMETLGAFFDKCLEIEIANVKSPSQKSNSDKKKDRLKLRQVYEKATCAFKDLPRLSDKYQQGRNEAVLL